MKNFMMSCVVFVVAFFAISCAEDTSTPPFGRACVANEQCGGAWNGYWVHCIEGVCAYPRPEDVWIQDTAGNEVDSGPQHECENDEDCPDDGLECTGVPVCLKDRFDLLRKKPLPNKCGQKNGCEPFCDKETDTCLPCTEAGCNDGSTCTEEYCDLTLGHCVFKVASDMCLIDSACYSNGETNWHDKCQVCFPEIENREWSSNTIPECQAIEQDEDPDLEIVDSDISETPDEFTPPDTEGVEEPDVEETADSEEPLDVTEPPPDEGEDIGEPEDSQEPADATNPEDTMTEDAGDNPDVEDTTDTEEPDVTVNLCEELNCDDNNGCTTDSCDAQIGCHHELNSKPCNADGNDCTQGDFCSQGICQAGPNLCECEKDSDCSSHEDGNLCNGTLVCSAHHCILAMETAVVCDTSVADQCHQVLCIPSSGDCVLANSLNNITCDDASLCTSDDTCFAGLCTGKQVDCDDNNACTTDSCDAQIGCHHELNSNPCTDNDVCTIGDICSVGVCKSGETQKVCTDEDPCTDNRCDSETGCESIPTNCDDSDPCTTDACNPATGCEHTGVICAETDENVCTTATCDPDSGDCINLPPPEEEVVFCEDDNACTLNDTCLGSVCEGTPISCSDDFACTTDSCNPATGCVFSPMNSACDDTFACTADVCDPTLGCIYTPIDSACNDNVACTTDSCNPATGCVFTFVDTDKDTVCDDDDPDDDNDGVNDGQDNCSLVANSDQANLDKDARGDACDTTKDCIRTGSKNLPAGFVNQLECAGGCVLPDESKTLVCYYTARFDFPLVCEKDLDGDGVSTVGGDCREYNGQILWQCTNGVPQENCGKTDWVMHDPPPDTP